MNDFGDMNHPATHGPESLSDEAAAWVIRVQSGDATEVEWLALESWLRGDVHRREAFDEAERLYFEFSDRATDLLALPQARPDAATPNLGAYRRRRDIVKSRPTRRWWPSVAVAASAVLALAGAWLMQPFGPSAQTYATDVGQRREIAFADGSRVELNTGSRLIAWVDHRHRRVTLESGEAIFDVAKDHAHPFVVAVGDQKVTVVGTQFDILRYGGLVAVTVNRGLVRVQPANDATAAAVRLGPGDQLRHVEGQTASNVLRVPADDVLAWRSGYVVYSNRTLAEITLDLSRYFAVPIRAQGSAARLMFSGALKIDDEDAVIRAIQGFLPVTAIHSASGIMLIGR